MVMEENLKRRKYKYFLITIKYLPYLIMLLDWIHTFSCIFGQHWVAISYIGGTSYLVLLSMLLTSYVFEFCSYHRIPLYYILLNNTIILYDYYIGISISSKEILDINLILIGITIVIMTLLYLKEKKHGKFNISFKKNIT